MDVDRHDTLYMWHPVSDEIWQGNEGQAALAVFGLKSGEPHWTVGPVIGVQLM